VAYERYGEIDTASSDAQGRYLGRRDSDMSYRATCSLCENIEKVFESKKKWLRQRKLFSKLGRYQSDAT
jgi:hypothetical protein